MCDDVESEFGAELSAECAGIGADVGTKFRADFGTICMIEHVNGYWPWR